MILIAHSGLTAPEWSPMTTVKSVVPNTTRNPRDSSHLPFGPFSPWLRHRNARNPTLWALQILQSSPAGKSTSLRGVTAAYRTKRAINSFTASYRPILDCLTSFHGVLRGPKQLIAFGELCLCTEGDFCRANAANGIFIPSAKRIPRVWAPSGSTRPIRMKCFYKGMRIR